MDRNEILQKLYSIRAGLSTISVKRDQVVQLNNRISDAESEMRNSKNKFDSDCQSQSSHILNTKGQIEDCQSRIEYNKKHLAYVEDLKRKGQFDKFIESTLEPYKEPYSNPPKKPKHGRMFYIFGTFFSIAITLILSGLIILILTQSAIIPDGGDLMLAEIAMMEAGVMMIIPFGILFKKRRRLYKERYKEYQKDCNRHIEWIEESKKEYADYRRAHISQKKHYYATLPDSIKADEILLEKLTAELPLLAGELEEYKAAYPAQKNQLVLKKDALCTEKSVTARYANGVYTQLVKDYNSFLSTGDWQNLDYIIYLFETGRADSIKESLQLLDQVKRHEMIIVAMGHISNNIRAGFGELKSTMMNGFSSMSSQLRSLSASLYSISAAQRANADMFESISSKVDVFSDLTRKANTTSEEMMKHVVEIQKSLQS